MLHKTNHPILTDTALAAGPKLTIYFESPQHAPGSSNLLEITHARRTHHNSFEYECLHAQVRYCHSVNVSVLGCGNIRAEHASCMAKLGHDVIGVDSDHTRVEKLAAGKAPFYEPEFDELLAAGAEYGTLTLTTDFAQAVDARIHFIIVGPPQKPIYNGANITIIDAAIDSLLPHLSAADAPFVVVGESTVPVDTADSLEKKVLDAGGILIWNPEFLRKSFAVHDTSRPERLVYGLSNNETRAEQSLAPLDEMYAHIIQAGVPRSTMNFSAAVLIKVSANSFLATKISFINETEEIPDATRADETKLAEAIGMYDRIGRMVLRAGIGYGGGSLPKDILSFQARAEELGLKFLRSLTCVNDIDECHHQHVADLIVRELSIVAGKRIAILGASFKSNIADSRESPALETAHRRPALGANVAIVGQAAGTLLLARDSETPIADNAHVAGKGAHATQLLTERDVFKELDPASLKPAQKPSSMGTTPSTPPVGRAKERNTWAWDAI